MQAKNAIQARRESSAILLLLIVLLSLARPLTPFISDGIAHTFFSEAHHTQLHQNGYNHLDADLQKMAEADQTDTGKTQVSTFSIETAFTFFTEITALETFINSSDLYFIEPLFRIDHGFTIPAIQPPDLSLVSLSLYAS